MLSRLSKILVCEQCGGDLDIGMPGDASFNRAANLLCWVCARLGRAAARETAIETKALDG